MLDSATFDVVDMTVARFRFPTSAAHCRFGRLNGQALARSEFARKAASVVGRAALQALMLMLKVCINLTVVFKTSLKGIFEKA